MARVANKVIIFAISLTLLTTAHPTAARALTPDSDFKDDGVVKFLDVSIVGSCFGDHPTTVAQFAIAETDGDGDTELTNFFFVIAAFGQSGFLTI